MLSRIQQGLIAPFLSISLLAQPAVPPKKFELTIDNIMRGPGLVGHEPSAVRWSWDNSKLYFQWKKYGDPQDTPMDTYVVNRDGVGLRKLSDDEVKQIPPSITGFGERNADHTKDRKRIVYSESGDLFLYDYEKGLRTQLTKTTEPESQPHFLKDEKRITFVRNNNLYIMALDSPMIEQVTDIRTGAAGAPAAAAAAAGPQGRRSTGGGGGAAQAVEQKGTERQEYLKKEERELLEVVKDRAKRREEAEAKRKKENPRKPYTLTARQSVGSLQLSPDGKYVVAAIIESGEGTKNNNVPNFVTESTYTEDIPSRNLVGDNQSRTRIAFIDAVTGEAKMADHGQQMSVKDERTKEETKRERPVQFLQAPIWNEDGSRAVMMGRAADNKDRWIFSVDPATGKTTVLVAMHDDAWIGGPGANTLGWMKNGRDIYFQSERDGYSHL